MARSMRLMKLLVAAVAMCAVLSAAGGDVLGSVFPEVPWHASINMAKWLALISIVP